MGWQKRKGYGRRSRSETLVGRYKQVLCRHSPALKQANNYALKLSHIFNSHSTRKSAMAKINRWISRVQNSGLRCFDRFLRTLNRCKGPIINYFKPERTVALLRGSTTRSRLSSADAMACASPQPCFSGCFWTRKAMINISEIHSYKMEGEPLKLSPRIVTKLY